MTMKWKRVEITTRCSDPTVVVTWKFLVNNQEQFAITEFQNTYWLTSKDHDGTHEFYEQTVEGEWGRIWHQFLERREADALREMANSENSDPYPNWMGRP